jgi:uncharacterized OB-fold protein
MRDDFPLPDLTWPGTQGFWDGAAAGELRIPRCQRPACGAFVWYPADACKACGGAVAWTAVSGRATLFSWTVVHQVLLKQFAGDVPYVTALAAIDEDPSVRIATRIVDAAPDELRIDMPLHVTFRPLRFAGVAGEVVAPFFRPA